MSIPYRSGDRRARVGIVVAAVFAIGLACAAKQRVPLDCVPEEVTVYVDQRALEGPPEALELRRDEPHKVFFKGPGYEPRLIVLEPHWDESGNQTLSPQRICVELVPIGVDRQLELEVEGEDDAAHSAPGRNGTP